MRARLPGWLMVALMAGACADSDGGRHSPPPPAEWPWVDVIVQNRTEAFVISLEYQHRGDSAWHEWMTAYLPAEHPVEGRVLPPNATMVLPSLDKGLYRFRWVVWSEATGFHSDPQTRRVLVEPDDRGQYVLELPLFRWSA